MMSELDRLWIRVGILHDRLVTEAWTTVALARRIHYQIDMLHDRIQVLARNERGRDELTLALQWLALETIEDIANQLALNLQKELKPRASDYEREQLQQAIEDFLR